MSNTQTAKSPPKSPCIGVCAVSARAGFCIGCGRKLAEIGGWRGLSDDEKRAVLDALPARLAALPQDAQLG
ncbi:MAG: DUF1289 domain-containing protein [Parvibaculales bacterium]